MRKLAFFHFKQNVQEISQTRKTNEQGVIKTKSLGVASTLVHIFYPASQKGEERENMFPLTIY